MEPALDPNLRRCAQAGPLRAPEPRARETAHGRGEKRANVFRKHIFTEKCVPSIVNTVRYRVYSK